MQWRMHQRILGEMSAKGCRIFSSFSFFGVPFFTNLIFSWLLSFSLDEMCHCSQIQIMALKCWLHDLLFKCTLKVEKQLISFGCYIFFFAFNLFLSSYALHWTKRKFKISKTNNEWQHFHKTTQNGITDFSFTVFNLSKQINSNRKTGKWYKGFYFVGRTQNIWSVD